MDWRLFVLFQLLLLAEASAWIPAVVKTFFTQRGQEQLVWSAQRELAPRLTVQRGAPDAAARVGKIFVYTIPADAFSVRVDKYQVNEAGASRLPFWLHANETSGTLSGVPSALDHGALMLEVTATWRHNNHEDVVTTHFRVNVDSFGDSRVLENGAERDFDVKCDSDQNVYHAVLVLDASLSELDAQRRVSTIRRCANFISQDVNKITLLSRQSESVSRLLGRHVVAAGPGDADPETDQPGVELSWVLACGDSFSQLQDFIQVIEHNVRTGRVARELGLRVIGWQVTETRPPEARRKLRRVRRQAMGTALPTPLPVAPVHPASVLTDDVFASDTTATQTPEASRPNSPVTLLPSSPVEPSLVVAETTSTSASLRTSSSVDSSASAEALLSSTDCPVSSPPHANSLASSMTDKWKRASDFMEYSSVPSLRPTLSGVEETAAESSSLVAFVGSSVVKASAVSSLDIESSTPTPTVLGGSHGVPMDGTVMHTAAEPAASEPDPAAVLPSAGAPSLSLPDMPSASSVETATAQLNTTALHTSQTSVFSPEIALWPSSGLLPTSQSHQSTVVWPSSDSLKEGAPAELETGAPVSSSSDDVLPLSAELPNINSADLSGAAPSTTQPFNLEDAGFASPSGPAGSPDVETSQPVKHPEFTSPSRSVGSPVAVTPSLRTFPSVTASAPVSSTITSGVPSSGSSDVVTSFPLVPSQAEHVVSMTHRLTPAETFPHKSEMNDVHAEEAASGGELEPTESDFHTTPLKETDFLTDAFQPEILETIALTVVATPAHPASEVFLTSTPSAELHSSRGVYEADGATSSVSSSAQLDVTPAPPEVTETSVSSRSNVTVATPTFSAVDVVNSSVTAATQLPPLSASAPLNVTVVGPPRTARIPSVMASPTVTVGIGIYASAGHENTDDLVTSSMTETPESHEAISTAPPSVETVAQSNGASAPLTDAPVNTPPLLLNPVDHVTVAVGRRFRFRVPIDTFYDLQDGATDALTMTLVHVDGTPLRAGSWIQLDARTQVVYGLPLPRDQAADAISREFALFATDSAGLVSERDAIVIRVNSSFVEDLNHVFSVTLDLEFSSFMSDRRNVIEAVRSIGRYLNDSDAGTLTVRDVRNGSVIIEWSDASLSRDVCENDTIAATFATLSNGSDVNPGFRSAMWPRFPVLSVSVELMGNCASSAVVGIPPLVIVKQSDDDEGPNVLLLTLVPALIVAVLVLVIAVALCYVRRKRRYSGKAMLDDERPVFGASRKPVLLANEFQMRDLSAKPKRPLVMNNDADSLRPVAGAADPSRPDSSRPAPPPYFYPDDFDPTLENHETPPPSYKGSPSEGDRPSPSGRQRPPEYRLPPPYTAHVNPVFPDRGSSEA